MHPRPIGFLALGLILALAAAAPAQDAASNDVPVVYPAGSEPQPEPSPVR